MLRAEKEIRDCGCFQILCHEMNIGFDDGDYDLENDYDDDDDNVCRENNND